LIRVRFAPSPTGYLHVGGARTALFNWLYARRLGGVFVLRIEDTDVERSSSEMVEGILDGLRWLGMDWDEGPNVGGPYGPYFQSERLERHRAMAARLVAQGDAYYCYCAPEELKAKRDAAEQAGSGWKYDRTCCRLTADDIAARERDRVPRAIRFKVPDGPMRFDDLVHGPIEFESANIEDFVLVRSDGQPTYQLSVVADDVEMAITHVVRGDDHISNTPKQILLYRALGADVPWFAHVPLILGPDKKRLSKRHGATSVMEYARQGFLPEAMMNFLALLGWSPGRRAEGETRDQELFTREELIAAFTLEGISGGNAVFNPEKLDWFNQQHIMRLALPELARRIKPVLEAAGLWDDGYLGDRQAWFFAVLELLKPRAKRLDDFAIQGRIFFARDIEYDAAAIDKHLRVSGMVDHLSALQAAFAALPAFGAVSTETALRAIADERGVKAAVLIHAVRVAVTGKTVSPGLFDVLALVGRDQVQARIRTAVQLASPSRS
jgi:glutamyl-tRNA synthetase